MGIIIRQSLKSTIVSYVGVLIGMFNMLWLMPKYFSPEQIGLFRLLQDVPIIVASMMQFGAASVADRFFPMFKTEDGKHNGFTFLLLSYAFLGYMFFLLTYWVFKADIISVYQEKSTLFTDNITYIIPLSLFVMYSSIFETYDRVHLRIVVPTLIREVILRILFFLLVCGYALQWYTFEWAIAIYVLSYALALFLLIVYTISAVQFFIQPKFSFIDKTLSRNIFNYILIVAPSSAASLVASKIDTLIIGAKLGLADIAIYNLAFFIGSIVDMPKRALSQISTPIISRAWNREDMSEIEMVYKKSVINQAIVGILIFLLIWLNIDILLSLVPKHEIYEQGKIVVLLIALGRLVDMFTGVNSEIIVTSPYYRINLAFIVIMAISTFIISFILVQEYGINGIALAALITMILYNLSKMIFIWYKLRIQPYDFSFIKLCGIALFILILFHWWPQQKNDLLISIGWIALRSLVIISLFVGMILYLKISGDVNKIFKDLISSVRNLNRSKDK